MSAEQQPFDPYAILAALDRQRVTYILIGGFARVIQGTDELTDGLDIVPSLRAENLRRLALALDELGRRARRPQAARPRGGDDPAGAGARTAQPAPASSRSSPSPPAPAAATTTSAAPPAANRSAEASAPRSPRSATSPACSPPSTANGTCHSSDSYDSSSSSNAAAAAASNANAKPSAPSPSRTATTNRDSKRDAYAPGCRNAS